MHTLCWFFLEGKNRDQVWLVSRAAPAAKKEKAAGTELRGSTPRNPQGAGTKLRLLLFPLLAGPRKGRRMVTRRKEDTVDRQNPLRHHLRIPGMIPLRIPHGFQVVQDFVHPQYHSNKDSHVDVQAPIPEMNSRTRSTRSMNCSMANDPSSACTRATVNKVLQLFTAGVP